MPNTGFLGWAYISGSTTSISNGLANKQVSFMSGSSILSGSSNFTYDYTSNELYLTGNLNISGTLKAESFIHKDVTEISSTGSTLFGDTADDTHVRTGSMYVTLQISSSTNVSASSFYGDGSNLSGISVSPGGDDTQVQFNDGGSTFGGDNGMVFNKTTNALTVTGPISSSVNISGSSFYGDGSNLSGVSTSPAGATTQIQFNNAGSAGASADLTFNDTTNTLILTGTLVSTGSGGPGYIFSLSGSTHNSSYGTSVSGKYALVADDKILIDAGPGASSELSLISANGKVTIGAGGYGGAPTDIMGARLDGGTSGASNTIASRTGAGIDVHSVKTLSLSGSAVNITGNISAINNLSASQNMSASAYYGDGSKLSGVLAGSDTYIQFNDGGSIGGEANFTFNKTTDVLNVSGSTRITGALDQGNNSGDNYFKLSSAYNAVQSNASGEFFQLPISQTLTAGIVYYVSGSTVTAVTASATGLGAESFLGFSTSTSLSADGLFIRGFYTFAGSLSASISSSAANMSFAAGKQIYASSITPGGLTTVQPTGSGDVVRVLGHAVDTKFMYFNPSPDFVTV